MRTSVLISLTIAALAVLWILSALLFPADNITGQNQESALSADKSPPIMDVRVRHSTAQQVTDFAVITGRSQANRMVDLASEINARVMAVPVSEGAAVSEGNVLAQLAVDDRAVRVSEAKRLLSQREIEYKAAKSLQLEGFNSEIRLAETRALLESAKAALSLAEKNFKNTKIIAPFDGIVSVQNIEKGDYVREGDTLLTIIDLDPMEMVGYVSEREILKLEAGSQIEVTFLDQRRATGTLTYISPAADPQTRTFRIKAEVHNGDFEIRDGLTAELKIPLKNIAAHLLPSAALSLDDQGQMGLKIVTEEQKVAFVPVHIIRSEADGVLLGGLPQTADVITIGGDFVAVGEFVNPVSEKNSEPTP